jgi:pimeloyl-ACP methyl ester carboxylesterase
MRNTLQKKNKNTNSLAVNHVSKGKGTPVVMAHGLAASLHDWNELMPALAEKGFAAHALDLLGHGESAKPKDLSSYTAEGVFAHLSGWIDSLNLTPPLFFIGHSLGGYIAIQYFLRFPKRIKALVLINPFYSIQQLPAALQLFFRQQLLNTTLIERTPYWLFRTLIDLSSLTFGSPTSAKFSLPHSVRIQTAVDYKRASPNIFNIPRTLQDLTPSLPSLTLPTLVIWGSNDQTLAPDSFPRLIETLPNAHGVSIPAGHVPHQSHPEQVNKLILDFLDKL